MISRRNLILRLSIAFNVAVLLYVATGMTGHGPPEFGDEQRRVREEPEADVPAPAANALPPASLSSSGRNLASIETAGGPEAAAGVPEVVAGGSEAAEPPAPAAAEPQSPAVPTSARPPPEKDPPKSDSSCSKPPPSPSGCQDRLLAPKYLQRGDHWVLLNYIRAERVFGCMESVTYTTHGDFSFLDNLPSLLDRWGGPVSLALFAPGEDFTRTLEAVSYARSCLSPLVRELVTFHLYFGVKDVPSKVPRPEETDFLPDYDCEGRLPPLPWGNGTTTSGNVTMPYTSYKSRKSLLYPVNVGRNIARAAATTHYVLPSDIELYPSPGLIDAFLDLVRREREAESAVVAPPAPPSPSPPAPSASNAPRVYVLSIFEIESGMNLPETKAELVHMLKNGSAIPFHKKVCPVCHAVPKAKEWQEAVPDGKGAPLGVFHVGKRTGPFYHWEPIFIGTDADPPYDERLSWEGKSDKMTQGYALCALDYEFRILDNAFLVHRPGIKTYKKDPKRNAIAAKTNTLIKKVIAPELKLIYGTRKGCIV
ncbi:beta-1,4-glucuronyltransferase 1 [Ischnura elegans]|uniref:beta-1,4-glucuronyltransferase 1 n=1 Tax=Ischnura elegans TaxID=197161 RepID=UPI001ED89AA8|nr:beta-1,4-glucuronyltransferase 1 [Ischnura elegans]XP_046398002.1 beta-1,4-glucuronyltransferase 1 [Ischnura elegans]